MSANRWLLLVPVLMAVSCWAQDDQAQKPVCNEENRGMLWPERISGDHVPVEMCSLKSKKYQWRPLTVDFSELLKSAKSRHGKGPLAAASAQDSMPPPDAEQSRSRSAPEQSPR